MMRPRKSLGNVESQIESVCRQQEQNQYAAGWFESDSLLRGHERLSSMQLLILSTTRSCAICLVVRGRAGFGRFVSFVEYASVRRFKLIIVVFGSAAIRRTNQ